MIGIILGWALFIFIAYKTSQVELDFKDFDPYAELEIDRVRLMYFFQDKRLHKVIHVTLWFLA